MSRCEVSPPTSAPPPGTITRVPGPRVQLTRYGCPERSASFRSLPPSGSSPTPRNRTSSTAQSSSFVKRAASANSCCSRCGRFGGEFQDGGCDVKGDRVRPSRDSILRAWWRELTLVQSVPIARLSRSMSGSTLLRDAAGAILPVPHSALQRPRFDVASRPPKVRVHCRVTPEIPDRPPASRLDHRGASRSTSTSFHRDGGARCGVFSARGRSCLRTGHRRRRVGDSSRSARSGRWIEDSSPGDAGARGETDVEAGFGGVGSTTIGVGAASRLGGLARPGVPAPLGVQLVPRFGRASRCVITLRLRRSQRARPGSFVS